MAQTMPMLAASVDPCHSHCEECMLNVIRWRNASLLAKCSVQPSSRPYVPVLMQLKTRSWSHWQLSLRSNSVISHLVVLVRGRRSGFRRAAAAAEILRSEEALQRNERGVVRLGRLEEAAPLELAVTLTHRVILHWLSMTESLNMGADARSRNRLWFK